MMTRNAILQALDERNGAGVAKRYGEKELERLLGDGLAVKVPQGAGVSEALEALKATRDDAGARVVILPQSYRIPSGDSNDAIKDVNEASYHGLHTPRFVQAAIAERLEDDLTAVKERAWLRQWNETRKTLTREAVRSARIKPETIEPYALEDAVLHPWSGPFLAPRKEGETPPKLGVGYWNLGYPHRFILIPYINAVHGARLLARSEMDELPERARGWVRVERVRSRDRFALTAKVRSTTNERKSYDVWFNGIPLVEPRAYSDAAEILWRLNAESTDKDFLWRGEYNTRMAQPTVKFSKHLVAAWLKASGVYPYLNGSPPLVWQGSPVPIPLARDGFALRKTHELETRVLIEHEGGALWPLNLTETSFLLATYEMALVTKEGLGGLFNYGPLIYTTNKGDKRSTLTRLIDIERKLIRKGPLGYAGLTNEEHTAYKDATKR